MGMSSVDSHSGFVGYIAGRSDGIMDDGNK